MRRLLAGLLLLLGCAGAEPEPAPQPTPQDPTAEAEPDARVVRSRLVAYHPTKDVVDVEAGSFPLDLPRRRQRVLVVARPGDELILVLKAGRVRAVRRPAPPPLRDALLRLRPDQPVRLRRQADLRWLRARVLEASDGETLVVAPRLADGTFAGRLVLRRRDLADLRAEP